jgi:hypothetical protein
MRNCGIKWTWLAASSMVLGAICVAQPASADIFFVSAEAPGVQNSTATFSASGVETFDGRGSGTQTFTSAFNNGVAGLTGVFSGVTVSSANQYGGAGGTGNYATDNNASYTVTLSQNVTYFGLWISAMNGGNVVTISNNGTQLTTFDTTSMATLIGSNSAYIGNPTAAFLHQAAGEPFAFVNFFDQTGSFNRITISGPGFESDNFTVGNFTSSSGTGVSGTADIPEPASLPLLVAGLLGIAILRRRAA